MLEYYARNVITHTPSNKLLHDHVLIIIVP